MRSATNRRACLGTRLSALKNFPRFCFAVWFGLCVTAGLASAQTVATVIPDFYSEPGLYPNRDYVNQNATEHIDPFTGALQLHVTDIHLPGNGGFDLNVIRSFNSSSIDVYNPTAARTQAGLGWDIHFGRVLNVTSGVCTGPNTNAMLELSDALGTKVDLVSRIGLRPRLRTRVEGEMVRVF